MSCPDCCGASAQGATGSFPRWRGCSCCFLALFPPVISTAAGMGPISARAAGESCCASCGVITVFRICGVLPTLRCDRRLVCFEVERSRSRIRFVYGAGEHILCPLLLPALLDSRPDSFTVVVRRVCRFEQSLQECKSGFFQARDLGFKNGRRQAFVSSLSHPGRPGLGRVIRWCLL